MNGAAVEFIGRPEGFCVAVEFFMFFDVKFAGPHGVFAKRSSSEEDQDPSVSCDGARFVAPPVALPPITALIAGGTPYGSAAGSKASVHCSVVMSNMRKNSWQPVSPGAPEPTSSIWRPKARHVGPTAPVLSSAILIQVKFGRLRTQKSLIRGPPCCTSPPNM